MRVCSLASSSKGNCTIVYNDTEIILVDMGITLKELEEKLNLLGLSCDNIIGAIVSHEHSDHTKGLGSLNKKYGTPVFCHSNAVAGVLKKSGLYEDALVRFSTAFELGSFVIDFFEVSHDVFCVGFNIFENSNKIFKITSTYIEKLKDETPTLKQRITKLINSELLR